MSSPRAWDLVNTGGLLVLGTYCILHHLPGW